MSSSMMLNFSFLSISCMTFLKQNEKEKCWDWWLRYIWLLVCYKNLILYSQFIPNYHLKSFCINLYKTIVGQIINYWHIFIMYMYIWSISHMWLCIHVPLHAYHYINLFSIQRTRVSIKFLKYMYIHVSTSIIHSMSWLKDLILIRST